MNPNYRGSRKHILDWTTLSDAVFLPSLNALLQPTGAAVGSSDLWMPQGYASPKEAKLSAGDSRFLQEGLKQQLSNWWLVYKRGANVPNWDLVATCSLEGQRGLVLIEAKAHENELSPAGKILRADASANSRANHQRIGKAIEEARQALNCITTGVGISRDSHYQLSNRVAFAWKLASLGVPVILIYLGFIEDTVIKDVGPCFESESHWQETVRNYVAQVLPSGLLERPIPCSAATMHMIIRSRAVLEPSPEKDVHTAMSRSRGRGAAQCGAAGAVQDDGASVDDGAGAAKGCRV
jgi:hypothetical protein